MEAIAALSLACNVTQLVGQAITISNIVKQLAHDGHTQEHLVLRTTVEQIEGLSESIRSRLELNSIHASLSPAEIRLRDIARQCRTTALQLNAEIESLSTEPGRRRAVLKTVSIIRAKPRIELLTNQLLREGQLLDTGILVSLRESMQRDHTAQQESISALYSDLTKTITDFRNAQENARLVSSLDLSQLGMRIDQMREAQETARADEALRADLLQSLTYDGMNQRLEQIDDAHEGTFLWIFETATVCADSSEAQQDLKGLDNENSEPLDTWVSGADHRVHDEASVYAQNEGQNSHNPLGEQGNTVTTLLGKTDLNAADVSEHFELDAIDNAVEDSNVSICKDPINDEQDDGGALLGELDDPSKAELLKFSTWLANGSGIYWISGKAGSGKSTLMKSVFDHPKTIDFLSSPVMPDKPVILKYSFWLAGSSMQRSFKGLLRGLAFQLASACPMVILRNMTGNGTTPLFRQGEDWSEKRLSNFVNDLLDNLRLTAPICAFLDGLDEIESDTDKEKCLDYLMDLSTLVNVKACVSSRPEEPWKSEFAKLPQLQLQNLTRPDINKYVASHAAKIWKKMARSHNSQQAQQEFVSSVVDGAEGVFLWARLVMNSIPKFRKRYTMEDLLAYVKALPAGIEDLYTDMLSRTSGIHTIDHVRKEAALYLQMCVYMTDYNRQLCIHECAVARRLALSSPQVKVYDEDQEGLRADCEETIDRIEDICGGMLEVQETKSSSPNPFRTVPEDVFSFKEVVFTHRTVLDYLTDSPIGKDLLSHCPIDELGLIRARVEAELIGWKLSLVTPKPERLAGFTCVFPPMYRSSENVSHQESVASLIRYIISALENVIVEYPEESDSSVDAVDSYDQIDAVYQFFRKAQTPDILHSGTWTAPAIDLPGFFLQEGFSAHYYSDLSKFVTVDASQAAHYTEWYKNYLLYCATIGGLVDVAIHLVENGASIFSELRLPHARPTSINAAVILLRNCLTFAHAGNVIHDFEHIIRKSKKTSCAIVFGMDLNQSEDDTEWDRWDWQSDRVLKDTLLPFVLSVYNTELALLDIVERLERVGYPIGIRGHEYGGIEQCWCTQFGAVPCQDVYSGWIREFERQFTVFPATQTHNTVLFLPFSMMSLEMSNKYWTVTGLWRPGEDDAGGEDISVSEQEKELLLHVSSRLKEWDGSAAEYVWDHLKSMGFYFDDSDPGIPVFSIPRFVR